MLVVIAPNFRAHKRDMGAGGEAGVWRNLRGEGGNADYGEMVQPS